MTLPRSSPVVALSEHFTFREMTRTSQGFVNLPSEAQVVRLRALCTTLLEPWRARSGRLYVSSGFRSKAVNEALIAAGYHAAKTSRHLDGDAADCKPLDRSLTDAWYDLLELVAGRLPVDQAIVYIRAPGKGWIHVQTARPGTAPRREALVDELGRKDLTPWSAYTGPLELGA